MRERGELSCGGGGGGGRCHVLTEGTPEGEHGYGNALNAWKSRYGDSHSEVAAGSSGREARRLKPGAG